MQARVEEVGQALLHRTQDVGGLGPRRKGKRNQHHTDAYEEHMLLPEVGMQLWRCTAQRMYLHAVHTLPVSAAHFVEHAPQQHMSYLYLCSIALFLLAFARC